MYSGHECSIKNATISSSNIPCERYCLMYGMRIIIFSAISSGVPFETAGWAAAGEFSLDEGVELDGTEVDEMEGSFSSAVFGLASLLAGVAAGIPSENGLVVQLLKRLPNHSESPMNEKIPCP